MAAGEGRWVSRQGQRGKRPVEERMGMAEGDLDHFERSFLVEREARMRLEAKVDTLTDRITWLLLGVAGIGLSLITASATFWTSR